MRFHAADRRPHGWPPPQTLQIPDWCGCTTEYIPVPVGDGWWQLVPIWDPYSDDEPAAAVRAVCAALITMGGRHLLKRWRGKCY
jgi:hypothetical protein